jgi:hypothetical protein
MCSTIDKRQGSSALLYNFLYRFFEDLASPCHVRLGDIQWRNEPDYVVDRRSKNEHSLLNTPLRNAACKVLRCVWIEEGVMGGCERRGELDSNHEALSTDIQKEIPESRIGLERVERVKELLGAANTGGQEGCIREGA